MSGPASAAAWKSMAYTPAFGKLMLTVAVPSPEMNIAWPPAGVVGTGPMPSIPTRWLSPNPSGSLYTPASPLNCHGEPDGRAHDRPEAIGTPSNPPSGTSMSSASPRGLVAPKYVAPPAPQM